uniref:Uncharacterized protein n=1 Tax=Timema monikensis TaxID=170555 RepID=A0A7R9EMP6_9NEOP|nr:unnamed protein product [Timema monikensis]
MALDDYWIATYLDVIDDYFEEEANHFVVIQRRHQDIFPMLEIDNPETQGLPLLHLQKILTTLQFYATEGLQFTTAEAELEAVRVLFYDKANFPGVLYEETAPTSLSRAPRGYVDLPVRNPHGEFRQSCPSLH